MEQVKIRQLEYNRNGSDNILLLFFFWMNSDWKAEGESYQFYIAGKYKGLSIIVIHQTCSLITTEISPKDILNAIQLLPPRWYKSLALAWDCWKVP